MDRIRRTGQTLHVAFVAHGALPIPPERWGATERVIWNLHRDSSRQGFESVVINTADHDQIRLQLAQCQPDIVHLHAEAHLAPCLDYARSHGMPLVLTSHTAWRHHADQPLPEHLAEPALACDYLIALSPSLKLAFERRGCRHVHYIPNGVDTTVFRPLPKRPRTVLAVGRNSKRKKLPEIARFFLDWPDYHLTICGPGADEPPRPELAIPRAPNITILGNQSEAEIAQLTGESEYFVHLCEVEACALVVREAMACGCKVWTVPYNAQGLKNVALSWESARSDADLGRRAAREAAQLLHWPAIVGQHANFYRAILARSAAA
ncbi:MAG: glycosyltransferase family 4 protein [Pirellulaceae bacterium]|nr:glycosyltransferase family 4 protein [Pirellulaceae bacterium]